MTRRNLLIVSIRIVVLAGLVVFESGTVSFSIAAADRQTKSVSTPPSTASHSGILQQPKKLSDRLTLLQQAKNEIITTKKIAAEITKPSQKSNDGGYLANVNVIDCFSSYSYKYTGGRYKDEEITFRLRVPPNMNVEKRYPLIVSLHGAGESNDNNTRQLSHLQYSLHMLAGPESVDCFVIVPHCPVDNRSWTSSLKYANGKGDSPIEYTKEIIDELVRVYPIDTRRISCFGLCSGAAGGWAMAARWPDLFCAMVTSQLVVVPHDPSISRLLGTSLWLFNNIDDPSFPVGPVREMAKQFSSLGGTVCLSEGSGGHNSWTRALRENRDAWLESTTVGVQSFLWFNLTHTRKS